MSPFELHHRRKPKTELTFIIKGNKSYISDWTMLNVSMPPKQIPIYVGRSEKGEVTDHVRPGRGKPHVARHTDRQREGRSSRLVRIPNTHAHFLRNGTRKKPLEGKNKEQPRIAVDGTEHTVRTADNKIFTEN